MTGYTGESFGFAPGRAVDDFIEGMNRHEGESFIAIAELSANISPVVTITAPSGEPVAQDEVVRVDTSDEKPSTVSVVQISIEFDNGLKETVYDSVYGFGPGYQGASNQVTDISDDEDDAVRVEFNRDAGWADAGATVRAITVDSDGNITDESEALTFDVAVTTIAVTAPGGEPIGATEIVRVDTTRTDPGTVTRVEVDIEFDNGVREVVWDGDEFGPGYQGVSNQQTSITDGFRTEFNRDAGWPDADGTVHVVVVDEQGVVEEEDQALTFDVSGETSNPPSVTFNPPSTPAETGAVMSLDVVDEDSAIKIIIVTVELPLSGIHEVAYMLIDGEETFGPRYQGGENGKEAITNGFRINLLRTGGWPEKAVQFHVTVTDDVV